MSRHNFIKEQELITQKKWSRYKYQIDAPEFYDEDNKNKFFVAFPFPYMNGRLHLGHVFSMIKADIMARHYLTRGYNVLFPFGYHATGIPISAAANRLKSELSQENFEHTQQQSKQYETMQKMDIHESEIPKFADPKYWIEYFPKIASEIDLPLLGCAIDYRRSFITTEINSHFDSFVRWQFNKLNVKGYLKFGKKMVIFSEKDNQPCSGADRSVGEEVQIRELKIALINHILGSYFVTFDPNVPSDCITRSSIFLESAYTVSVSKINHLDVHCGYITMPKFFRRNLFHQNEINECKRNRTNRNLEIGFHHFVLMPETKMIHGSGLYTSDPNLEWFSYYEPEAEVISRSGDTCIVAATDQWYIMYDDPEWKKSVYDHTLNNIKFTDDVVKHLILETIEKNHPWPFSRTFGMGSRIPFDEKYLIDSLSDSTIYMAYYTVSHIINQITEQEMSDDVWDTIFFGKETDISNKYPTLFSKMRNEFSYWYPLDLRVSGKDLITNHLVMMLFNHMAIFGPDMMPKNIYANGHILVNGEKMSKNKGNFITLKQSIDKYGVNVTRFIAAQAGDDINDGNFNLDDVDSSVLVMYAEIQNWNKLNLLDTINHRRCGQFEFTDHLHLIKLNKILNKVFEAYSEMKFRDVIKYGFYELQNLRNKYNNPHDDILRLFLQAELAFMNPIIPHWVDYMSSTYNMLSTWPSIKIDSKYDNPKTEWLDNYCQLIQYKISKSMKKYKPPCGQGTLPKKCDIQINKDVKHYLDEIVKFNTNDKNERKTLLSQYKNQKQIVCVIELFTHIDKMSKFEKNELMLWLVEDHKAVLESYLQICHPNISININYSNKFSNCYDPLNPVFNFE